MNNLYTINKTIILQLFVGITLFNHSLYSMILINNKPLNQLIKSNQELVFTSKLKDNFTVINIQNNNIKLKYDSITKLNNLKEVFEKLNSKKSGGIISKNMDFITNTIDYNNSYLRAQKKINIEAKILLNLNSCLIESPNITITGNQKMNFYNCFLINPQTLDIITNNSKSNYRMIRITFNEDSTYPITITGEIDLENNQTPKILLLTNVKKIEIHFSPKIWEN